MSVNTTSDENIASAKKHIRETIKDLSAILINSAILMDERGWCGFSDEFREEMTKIMLELIWIGDKL